MTVTNVTSNNAQTYTPEVIKWKSAKNFVDAAWMIMSNDVRRHLDSDMAYYVPYHALLSNALELYFKAYLTSHGHTEKELKAYGVRHSLNKLLEMCEAKGFSSTHATELAGLLNEKHENFEYRYMNTQTSYFSFSPAKTFDHFGHLHTQIDSDLKLSASLSKPVEILIWSLAPDLNRWRVPADSIRTVV